MVLAETQFGKFFYFESDVIGQAVASGQFWDDHLRPFMDARGPGSILVDVGSNIGFFTVYCGLRGCEVHSFEASPEVFELLQKNIKENGLSELVHSYNLALYDKRVELRVNPAWTDFAGKPDGEIDYERSPNSGGAQSCAP